MPARSRFIAPIAAALAIACYAYAQTPEIKPGQWSFTMSGTMFGGLSESADGLPPEVLAQLAAELSVQLAAPNHYETCLTPEDVADLNFDEDDADECTETSRKIDGKVVTLTQQCSDSVDTVRVEIASPESVKIMVESESDEGSVNLSITGEWIGPTCTEESR